MAPQFRQFQAFHAIIETGTVTAAAEQLGISQPGISNLLAQLERATRIRLFHRAKGRLQPTPEAMVLFNEIDTVVRGLDHVNQAVVDLQNQKAGQLQVVGTHAMAFSFLPEVVAGFTTDKPQLTISFQSQYSAKIQEWVAAGLFEIGVCEMPLRQDGLETRAFFFETQCAVPEGSAMAAHAVLTPALLDGFPFIVMGADHMVSRRTREAFHGAQAHWQVRCHTDLFRNALNMVRRGVGAALIDPFTLASDPGGGYVVRPFRPRVLLDIILVTSRSRPVSGIGRQFLDRLVPAMQALAVPG